MYESRFVTFCNKPESVISMDFIKILLGALKTLDIPQLLSLKKIIFNPDIKMTDEEFIKLVRNHHENHKHSCPYCKSMNVAKFGFTKSKSQRFKCNLCRRTFSTFTDTPLSYTKKPMEQWVKYIKQMESGRSIRLSAKSIGINIATSFQWRHKILKAVLEMNNDKLNGIIEIDEVFLAESFKGNHSKSKNSQLNRNSRQRGMDLAEYLNNNKVSVLCCRDRNDSMFTRTADRCKTRFNIMVKLLGDRLPKGSTLCTNNNMAFIPLSKKLGCNHYKMRDCFEIKEKRYHIQNVGVFGQEIKSKIKNHFKGVATKYLNHYLVWIHWMAKTKGRIVEYSLVDMLAMIMLSGKVLRIRDFYLVNSLPA